MNTQDKADWVGLIAALAVICISSLVIFGWLFDLPMITSISALWNSMVMNTAICSLLCAISLYLNYFFKFNTAQIFHRASALIIIAISTFVLAEMMLNLPINIDLPELHGVYQFDKAHPGRMAPNTAIGLLMLGIGLLITSLNQQTEHIRRLRKVLSTITFVIATLGLIGYLFNISALYTVKNYPQMALPTAINLTLLAIGLYFLNTEKVGDDDAVLVKRIYSKVLFILVFITFISTFTSFILLTNNTKKILAENLKQATTDRVFLFDVTIKYRSERALVASKNREILQLLSSIKQQGGNQAPVARLNEIAFNLIPNGFDAVYFTQVSGQKIAGFDYIGETQGPAFFLNAKYGSWLFWHNGYVLNTQIPIKNQGNTILGYMVTKQRLLALDELRSHTRVNENITDMIVCGADGGTFKCFPSSVEDKPFSMPKFHGRQRLVMSRALDLNETGIRENIDYRGNRVLASFGKIPNTNLAMIVKTDLSTLYQPVRLQLYKTVAALSVIILLGLLLIRGRLIPLVSRLKASKDQSEQAMQQFIAAAEGSLDAFLILKAVRDEHGKVQNYVCTYANDIVCAMFDCDKQALTDSLLYTVLPFLRSTKFSSKYQYVIESGKTISEELKVDLPAFSITWISHQVVKLGDGVAVTMRDLTKKKKIESALAESERTQSAIVRSVAYSIIATDIEGTIISMNQAAKNMLWYDAEELVGKHTPEIIHDKDEVIARASELSLELGRYIAPGFEVFVAKADEGMPEEREWTYIRKDGSRFPVKLSVAQLKDEQQQVCGYLGIAYDMTELKRNEEYIKHIALHDVLTGLPNRTLYSDRAGMAFEHAKREHKKVAIALLDLDHFKHVNDSLGHHIGDVLLQEVTQRLNRSIRPTDTVARMGGDEFAFILPNLKQSDDVLSVFNKILKTLKPALTASNHQLHVTASIGISIYPDHGNDLSQLLRNADTAMYKAKALGRNNLQLFTSEMESQATKRMALETDLRQAILDEDFELYYQPQFDLKSNQISGVEALLRWQKSAGVFISPAEFIPIAEESGLIVPLGEWVIKTACADAKIIKEKFGRPIRMAVNLSPRQFSQKDMATSILDTLKQAALSPEFFEVEITENVLMTDIENSEHILAQLHKAGVKVALDDFGTGYSSLSYLTKFPIDRIKIDQSFIRNITANSESASLAKVIINLAKSLNIPSIAEGVETKEQYDFVKSTDCNEVQGFYLGKPMKFETLIARYF